MRREEKLVALSSYFKDHLIISTTMLASMNIQHPQIQDFIKNGILIKEGWGRYKKGNNLEINQTQIVEKKEIVSESNQVENPKNLSKFEVLESYLQKNPTIDTATLTSMKISSYNIKKLLEQKVLTKVSRGFYQKATFSLSEEKNMNKEEEKSSDTMIEQGLSFNEFEQLLLDRKYQQAVTGGLDLNNLSMEETKLLNTYLILLSQFVEFSRNERIYVENLKIEDCQLSKGSLSEDEKILLSIFNKRFPFAMRQILNKYDEFSQVEQTDQILLGLLQEISRFIRKNRVLEINLQTQNQYLELQQFLNKQKENNMLPENEQFLLQLVNLICSEETIHYSNKPCYSVYEGIECQNYQKALEWEEKYARENRLSDDQRLLMPALKKVLEKIELQRTIRQNKKSASESKEIIAKEESTSTQNITVPQILKVLWEGNIEDSTQLLIEYLHSQKKLQYFNILKELIQLGALENDPFYKTFYEALFQIEAGTYEYSLSDYMIAFASVVDEDPERAEIYYNIVKSGKYLGIECYFLSELSQKIESSKQKYTKKLS